MTYEDIVEVHAKKWARRDPAVRRRADALRQQACRDRKKAAKVAAGEVTGDTNGLVAFQKRNRELLPVKTLQTMLAQQEQVRNILDEMELIGHPEFPEFTLERVTANVLRSVKEHGVAHLGAITRSDEIPSDWSQQEYWKSPLRVLLEREGPQTAQYVRCGLLIALPDWRVERFLVDKAGWSWDKVAVLLDFDISRNVVRYR